MSTSQGPIDAPPPSHPHLETLWGALDGPQGALDSVTFCGGAAPLPSIYPVAETAAAQVAAATLAVSELLAARTRTPLRPVRIDGRHVAAAFRSERYQRPIGWHPSAASVWDPIAGDYEAKDGWIRLHTNYASHRDAALRALGTAADRAAVASAVRSWGAVALESAVIEAGGCAAAMHTPAEWRLHPQGEAVRGEPLVHVLHASAPRASFELETAATRSAPLHGVRVLDLTRVIAGPVCTRFLGAYGADVMRVDPPGFEEVPALLGDTTGGSAASRSTFTRRPIAAPSSGSSRRRASW